jgi:inner membrane protein
MILFGHIGITTAVVNSYKKVVKPRKLDIDYRFVILGAILPDLVDKPIVSFFTNSVGRGERFIGHTLAFSIGVLLIGVINLVLRKRTSLLILGVGSLIHTLLDLMWVFPKTYLFPIYGFNIPMILDPGKIPLYAKLYFSIYSYLFWEIVGLFIIYKYCFKKMKLRGLLEFITKGRL